MTNGRLSQTEGLLANQSESLEEAPQSSPSGRMSQADWMMANRSESFAEAPRSCCCMKLRSAWVCSLAFIWFPWIFFQGSHNVLTTCERPELSAWLKLFSLLTILGPAAGLTALAVLSMIGARCSTGTPISGGHLSAMHFLVLAAMAAYGWYIYMGSTSKFCDGAGPYKPHALLLGAVLVVTLLAGTLVWVGLWAQWRGPTIQDDYQPPPWGGYI